MPEQPIDTDKLLGQFALWFKKSLIVLWFNELENDVASWRDELENDVALWKEKLEDNVDRWLNNPEAI